VRFFLQNFVLFSSTWNTAMWKSMTAEILSTESPSAVNLEQYVRELSDYLLQVRAEARWFGLPIEWE